MCSSDLLVNASTANLLSIASDLQAAGKTVKVTVLPTRRPSKQFLTSERVGGGKTAWRPAIKMGHASRHLKAGVAN